MDDKVFEDILKEYWGYDSFRGIQLDIIRSIYSGKDTLGLMPTGGGKSIAFQVPALAMEGICIVITPLIALMKDQVLHLRQRGIKAVAIYSGQSREEMNRNLDNCLFGDYKFLYVSPERLASESFIAKVRKMKVSFVTVDEAHCISQWGYDFRPSYLRLSELRRQVGSVPVLALTATATHRVADDIQNQLAFASHNVFRMSFERKNLCYVVRKTEDKPSQLLHILGSVEGSAIVYTRSRKGTKEVCDFLNSNGIEAFYYHAGLTNIDKDIRQKAWQEGEVRVMVATNAFGMGIDKADVRLVIHTDLPDSIEAYYQEAGRAGRDGNKAYCVILYNRRDHAKMKRRISDNFPAKEYIRKVYDDMGNFFQLAVGDGYGVSFDFDSERFCRNFKHFPVPMESALGILARSGYIDYREEEESSSRLMFLISRNDIYGLGHLGAMADRIVQAVLRNYGGVFSDYIFIEEAQLAHDCQTSVQEVYETLKALTQQRILNYVPRKNVPRVTYLSRREEMERIVIPPSAYEERRDLYAERVDAMLGYCEEDETCRSKYLVGYFGDTDVGECGHCDVCLSQKRNAANRAMQLAARIAAYVKSQGKVSPARLPHEGYTDKDLQEALAYLTREEIIKIEDGMLTCL